MEPFIDKLSAIETAASRIMEEAIEETRLQDQEIEKRTAESDARLEADACKKLETLRQNLQSESQKTLEQLKKHTDDKLIQMENCYKKDHQSIADEIYQQIVRM